MLTTFKTFNIAPITELIMMGPIIVIIIIIFARLDHQSMIGASNMTTMDQSLIRIVTLRCLVTVLGGLVTNIIRS